MQYIAYVCSCCTTSFHPCDIVRHFPVRHFPVCHFPVLHIPVLQIQLSPRSIQVEPVCSEIFEWLYTSVWRLRWSMVTIDHWFFTDSLSTIFAPRLTDRHCELTSSIYACCLLLVGAFLHPLQSNLWCYIHTGGIHVYYFLFFQITPFIWVFIYFILLPMIELL